MSDGKRINALSSEGALLGTGFGFAASKTVKLDPKTNFVADFQREQIANQVSRNVFYKQGGNDVIRRADEVLNSADEIRKLDTEGLKKLADEFKIRYAENTTADSLLGVIKGRYDKAISSIAKRTKFTRTFNFMALGAAALGIVGLTIGIISSKYKKSKNV